MTKKLYIRFLRSDCNTQGKIKKFKIKECGGKKIVVKHLIAQRGYNVRFPIRQAKWNSQDSHGLRLDDQIGLKLSKNKNPFLKSTRTIAKLRKIECRRGLRHLIKLPVRGQRTRTNANTIKRKKVSKF